MSNWYWGVAPSKVLLAVTIPLLGQVVLLGTPKTVCAKASKPVNCIIGNKKNSTISNVFFVEISKLIFIALIYFCLYRSLIKCLHMTTKTDLLKKNEPFRLLFRFKCRHFFYCEFIFKQNCIYIDIWFHVLKIDFLFAY